MVAGYFLNSTCATDYTDSTTWGWDSTVATWSTTTASSSDVIWWPDNQWVISERTVLVPSRAEILTPAEARRRQARRSREVEVLESERQIAARKGRLLLRDVIGEVMYRRLADEGYVDIPSTKHVNLRYRIRFNRMIGIARLRNGAWTETEHLCIHPDRGHVAGDEAAIQALLCMYDEDMLWKTGNLWDYPVRAAAA